MDSLMVPVYQFGRVMAFGHFEAWVSIINFSWVILTILIKRGSCPVAAAKNATVTAIEINFDRPIGFSSFLLLTALEEGSPFAGWSGSS